MNFLKTILVIPLMAVSISTSADSRSRDAAVGGGLGGALGGYIGSETGGRAGAIIGSTTGAAIGSAITTNSNAPIMNRELRHYDEGDYGYRDHRYNDYQPRHKKQKKHKKCPPGLAMQNRC